MLLCSLLLACRSGPNEGTFVGNPGETKSQLASYDSSVSLSKATASVNFSDAEDCSGDVSREDGEPVTLDLLADNRFDLPAGAWCAVGVDFQTIELIGMYSETYRFEMTLTPGFVDMYAPTEFIIDGTTFVLELAEPGWLSEEVLRSIEWYDGIVVVTEDDPLSALLSDTIAARSALFADDGDGVLSDDERDVGPIASGTSREENVPTDTGDRDGFPASNGGCGGGGLALLLLLPGLGLRRRMFLHPYTRPDSCAGAAAFAWF